MKKVIFLIIIFYSQNFYCQSSEIYEVDYVLKLNNEVLNESLKTMEHESSKSFIVKHANNFEEVKAKLLFNAEGAKYAVQKQLESDSKPTSNFFERYAGSESVYYYDNKKKRSYYTSFLKSKTNVVYKREEWKILNETEEILGFTCYKAELVVDQEGKMFAWFTNEIPYPYGPLRFNNLPGLILKVEVKDGLITYLATKIKKKRKSTSIIEESDYQFMDEDEYKAALNKNNPLFEGF